MTRNTFKSTGSVLAGLIAVVILSNGTDMILETTGVFSPVAEQLKNGFTTMWMLLLALLYRTVYMIIGGYITAWLSPGKPMKHVFILGLIGTVLGIAGAVAAWGIAPSWFLILMILLGLPSVWIGGRLKEKQKAKIITL